MEPDGALMEPDEIEIGEGSDKENEKEARIRQPKTTTDQFDMIVSFMEANNEELLDKETFGLLWEDLASRLNDIGPPEHSVVQWKRVWSVYKYNRKRRRSGNKSMCNVEPNNDPQLDQSSNLTPPPLKKILGEDVGTSDVQLQPQILDVGTSDTENVQLQSQILDVGTSDTGNVRFQSQILEKLDVLIKNQNIMISTQEVSIQQLKESTELMKKIAKKGL